MSDFDGYITAIKVGGKTYKLRCEIVEIHELTCPKCGGEIELKFGTGKCKYCDTLFSTKIKLVEENLNG